MATGPMTKADYAAQQLRERIFSGELAPGQRLLVEHLKVELSMSPTPIREALRVLQSEGVIVHKAHHGMVVARQSVEDVQEICDLRAVLELHALELAIPKMDEQTLTALEQLQADFASANERGEITQAIAINYDWHWLIYRMAGSSRLEDSIQRLWTAFPWRVIGTFPGRISQAVAEHTLILEAIRDRDVTAATKHLRDHIMLGEEGLLQRLRELGDAAAS